MEQISRISVILDIRTTIWIPTQSSISLYQFNALDMWDIFEMLYEMATH